MISILKHTTVADLQEISPSQDELSRSHMLVIPDLHSRPVTAMYLMSPPCRAQELSAAREESIHEGLL